jgi:hypothetical protein
MHALTSLHFLATAFASADDCLLLPTPVWKAGRMDFIELMIPELRRRGLFRNEYEGCALSENPGLPGPDNSFSRRDKVAA